MSKPSLAALVALLVAGSLQAEAPSFTLARGEVNATDQESDECSFSVGFHSTIIFHPRDVACLRMRELRGRYGRLQFVVEDPPARVAFIRPPAFLTQRSDLWFHVRVTPRPEHRLLTVRAADQLGDVRRSDESLAGARAPSLFDIRWNALPVGEYDLRAEVRSHVRLEGAATHHLQVLP